MKNKTIPTILIEQAKLATGETLNVRIEVPVRAQPYSKQQYERLLADYIYTVLHSFYNVRRKAIVIIKEQHLDKWEALAQIKQALDICHNHSLVGITRKVCSIEKSIRTACPPPTSRHYHWSLKMNELITFCYASNKENSGALCGQPTELGD